MENIIEFPHPKVLTDTLPDAVDCIAFSKIIDFDKMEVPNHCKETVDKIFNKLDTLGHLTGGYFGSYIIPLSYYQFTEEDKDGNVDFEPVPGVGHVLTIIFKTTGISKEDLNLLFNNQAFFNEEESGINDNWNFKGV